MARKIISAGRKRLSVLELRGGVANRCPWWPLQRSTMTNGGFDNNRGSVKVLVDSGNRSTTSMTFPDESDVPTTYGWENGERSPPP